MSEVRSLTRLEYPSQVGNRTEKKFKTLNFHLYHESVLVILVGRSSFEYFSCVSEEENLVKIAPLITLQSVPPISCG